MPRGAMGVGRELRSRRRCRKEEEGREGVYVGCRVL